MHKRLPPDADPCRTSGPQSNARAPSKGQAEQLQAADGSRGLSSAAPAFTRTARLAGATAYPS